MANEIIVVPFPDPGHVFPAIELSNHLANRNYKITLLLPSPTSLPLHPLIQIVAPSDAPPRNAYPFQGPVVLQDHFTDILTKRFNGQDSSPLPICAIVDEMMMRHLVDTCKEYEIPAVSFFTSSACSYAVDHAASKLSSGGLSPGQTVTLSGLPDDMSLTESDLTHRDPPMRGPFGPGRFGGPPPPRFGSGHGGDRFGGGPPRRGIAGTTDAIALLFNTCDDLERPFLEYVAKETKKPAWGVGPLLPAQFWSAAGSIVHDEGIRTKRESNVSEREVLQWLDAKPRGSVIYVSFGTLVGPSEGELAELAAGLSESNRPFIWVLQPGATRHDPAGHPIQTNGHGDGGFFPDDLARRVDGRGLVIRGWAPQLLILTHPSTAGFMTHCGWNSTVEALGCGVPMLTWPIRGDQWLNMKLVTSRLKVGCTIRAAEGDAPVKKGDVVRGIERLMADEEMKKRAATVRSIFSGGFPKCSSASFDALVDFIKANC